MQGTPSCRTQQFALNRFENHLPDKLRVLAKYKGISDSIW